MKTIIHYAGLCAVTAWFIHIAFPSAIESDPNANPVLAGIQIGILVGTIIFVYFLPSYIAIRRRHTNAVPVVLFNIFLGWTFVSWVWCLISACASVPPVQVIHQGRVDHYAHRPQYDDWGRPISSHD